MDDTLQTILSFLVSVIILFIFPIYIAYEKKDDLAYALSAKYVSEFVEEVKIKGYISSDMYDRLNANLLNTGNTFDIFMEHKAIKYYPANNADKYIKVEEVYTQAQILEVLGREEQVVNFLGQLYFVDMLDPKSALKDEESIMAAYKNLSLKNIPIRANMFDVKGEIESQISIYPMNIGDEFNIRIKNNNTTIATSLFNTFTANNTNKELTPRIYVNYGAIITAEKYWDLSN